MSALGINLAGLVTQIVSFLILFIALWLVLYKPISRAMRERSSRIQEGLEAADRFREEELAKARQEIRAERERAEADIQRERDAAVEELRREFAAMAVDAAEKIVERSIDESAHRDLIDKVLEDSGALGGRR